MDCTLRIRRIYKMSIELKEALENLEQTCAGRNRYSIYKYSTGFVLEKKQRSFNWSIKERFKIVVEGLIKNEDASNIIILNVDLVNWVGMFIVIAIFNIFVLFSSKNGFKDFLFGLFGCLLIISLNAFFKYLAALDLLDEIERTLGIKYFTRN